MTNFGLQYNVTKYVTAAICLSKHAQLLSFTWVKLDRVPITYPLGAAYDTTGSHYYTALNYL